MHKPLLFGVIMPSTNTTCFEYKIASKRSCFLKFKNYNIKFHFERVKTCMKNQLFIYTYICSKINS